MADFRLTEGPLAGAGQGWHDAKHGVDSAHVQHSAHYPRKRAIEERCESQSPFVPVCSIAFACRLSMAIPHAKVFEKSARVEQQNEKIADLLARNQKSVSYRCCAWRLQLTVPDLWRRATRFWSNATSRFTHRLRMRRRECWSWSRKRFVGIREFFDSCHFLLTPGSLDR